MVKQKSDDIKSSEGLKTSINAKAIRSLADLLNETGLTEIEYEAHGCRIRVGKMAPSVGAHVVQPTISQTPEATTCLTTSRDSQTADLSKHPGAVCAPMVGTAYLSPKPDAPAFVKVGDTVQKDDTLLIIEAMKVMNPIRAPKAGTISKILIENAVPVEYGQLLFVIE